MLTDVDGNVVNHYEYDVFGKRQSICEQEENRYGYTGEVYDNVTEQYYLRARYYNPVIGRFTQEDEYRGDGLNLYAYCGNNPVRYADPSGYGCKKTGGEGNNSSKQGKTLKEWLKNDQALLDECTDWHNNNPECWSIDQDNTNVFYRTIEEVKTIRKKQEKAEGIILMV